MININEHQSYINKVIENIYYASIFPGLTKYLHLGYSKKYLEKEIKSLKKLELETKKLKLILNKIVDIQKETNPEKFSADIEKIRIELAEYTK